MNDIGVVVYDETNREEDEIVNVTEAEERGNTDHLVYGSNETVQQDEPEYKGAAQADVVVCVSVGDDKVVADRILRADEEPLHEVQGLQGRL